jgi:hypothetical protein
MIAPSAPTVFECAPDETDAPDCVVEMAVILLLYVGRTWAVVAGASLMSARRESRMETTSQESM